MRKFRFRLVPFIATMLLVALGCSLSYWQTQRAHQKEKIEAQLQARENQPVIALPGSVDITQMEYARVMLKGEFLKDWPIYLDNRPMNGVAGFVVMMPFKLQDKLQNKLQNKLQDRAHYVLVARGWIPRNAQDRTAIELYETPSGVIQIEGILKTTSGRVLQLGQSAPLTPKAITQNLDADAFTKASGLPTYSFIVEQTSDTKDGLLRQWSRASAGSERHRGYAFQWLALAIMALLFFLVTGFKHEQRSD